MKHPDIPDWEANLKTALDAVSDLSDEEPPRLESLQTLVAQVQSDQRRKTVRALAAFWAVAVVIIGGVLFAMSRQPVYFFMTEGVLALLMIAGALVYGRKQVSE